MKNATSRFGVTGTVVCLIAAGVTVPRVLGEVGDVVGEPFTPSLPDPYFCAIGLAFDGAWLYVTSCGQPYIYRVSPTDGAWIESLNPQVPERPAALAYDAGRGGFWVATQKGWGVTGFRGCCDGPCSGTMNEGSPIYFWKPGDDTATFKFLVPWTLANDATGDRFLSNCLIYGLAYRPGSDELWITDNLNRNIAVFTTSGQFLRGLNAASEEANLFRCNGLAVGTDLVYLANAGPPGCGDACGDVFRASELSLGIGILDQLVDGQDRFEGDMECDPITFAPMSAMWVRTSPQGNAANDLLTAYEIEPGGCGPGISVGACCDGVASTCRDVAQAACGGTWTEGVLCSQLDPPCFPVHRIILLDRTGSMQAITSNGQTRCVRALETVKSEVMSFFATKPIGSSVAVWTFAGSAPTPLTAGFVNEGDALLALNGLDALSCDDFTPLAESVCGAVDFLLTTFPSEPTATLEVSISSDGNENMSDGECFGPNSLLGTECPSMNAVEPFEVGSWQEKVCAKIQGNAVVLAKFWGPPEILIAKIETDQETGALRGLGVSDLTFFAALTQTTGGQLIVIPDNGPVPSGASSFGVSGACCLPTGQCQDSVTQAECASLNGTHQGENSTCDNLPQACVAIPALSEWGAGILALSVLVGGTIVLRQRWTTVA